jgi:hypothetical protein
MASTIAGVLGGLLIGAGLEAGALVGCGAAAVVGLAAGAAGAAVGTLVAAGAAGADVAGAGGGPELHAAMNNDVTTRAVDPSCLRDVGMSLPRSLAECGQLTFDTDRGDGFSKLPLE